MENTKFVKFVLGLIAMVIIVYILKELKSIFIPLTFAIFLSFLFAPLNRFLANKKIPNSIILLIMVIIILFTFTLVGTVVYTSTASFATEFPEYEIKIVQIFQHAITAWNLPIDEVSSFMNNKINWPLIAEKLSLAKVIGVTMGSFINFFVKLLLTVAFMFFIVLGRHKLAKRLENTISEQEVHHSFKLTAKIEEQIRTYLFNKTLISIITALIGIIFISIFKIDFIIISGLLIFILNFIPHIGSLFASAFPILVCAVQYGFGWRFLGISTTLISTQMIMGNFVEPKIMGTELHLSPIIILMALIFWYWVWGPVGMILAIPITSALNLVFKQFISMKIISAIMSTD